MFDWALLQAPWAAEAYGDAIWLRETMFGRGPMAGQRPVEPRPVAPGDRRRGVGRDRRHGCGRARPRPCVLLTIRGTPFLYYGEEIGMRDVAIPSDEIIDPPARRALSDPDFQWWNRDQCRTRRCRGRPSPGHGFTTGRPWLRFGDDADQRNVAAQEAETGLGAGHLPPADRPAPRARTRYASGALHLASLGDAGRPRLAPRGARRPRARRGRISPRTSATSTVPNGDGAGASRPVGGSHVDPSAPGPRGNSSRCGRSRRVILAAG